MHDGTVDRRELADRAEQARVSPATLVSASSTGMPAATSAPNANTRMISVIGSERSIDLPISSLRFSATPC